MHTVYYLVLVPMVYLAIGVFLLGNLYRLIQLIRQPGLPQSLAIYPRKDPAWLFAVAASLGLPSVWRHNKTLWVFLMAFHISFFLVFLGHLELITEMRFLQWVPHEIFLGQGFLGLILSLSLLYFLLRRLVSPTKELSVPEDYLLLVLLLLTVIFGSEMDWARRWYGYAEMSVADYRAYLLSLVLFRPEITSVTQTGHSFILVLHVFFGNLFLIFFPFSHLTHAMFSFALNTIRRK